jgi:hypothetical protein
VFFVTIPVIHVNASVVDSVIDIGTDFVAWYAGTLVGTVPEIVSGIHGGQTIRVSADMFRAALAKAYTDRTGVNPDLLRFEGQYMLFQYQGYNHLQIGEYVFNTNLTRLYLEHVSATPVGRSTYLIPYFIYDGDLYFLNGTSNTIATVGEWRATNANNFMLGNSFTAGPRESFDWFGFNIQNGISNISLQFKWRSHNNPSNHDFRHASWNNISKMLRNRQNGISETSGAIQTFPQMNLTNTEIREFGIIHVPSNFEAHINMNFWDYIRTLTPNELYQQVPETIETPFPLPPELHDLGDDDEIEFHVDEDGRVTIVVHQKERDDNSSGNGGIIAALVAIAVSIAAVPSAIVSGLSNVLQTLFIPREGFLDNQLTALQDKFDERLPIVGQFQTLFSSFIEQLSSASTEPPKFEFEIFGSTVNMFPTEHVEPFMPIVHALIIVTSYYLFIRRTIRRLPKAIGGIEK